MHLLIDGRPIQDHFPGIGRYVFNLIDALASQLNGDLTVIINPGQPNTRFDLQDLARHPNLRLFETDIPNFHWREQLELPRLIDRLRPDLVHLPYYVRPYRLHRPTILTLYDVIPRLFPAYFSARKRWIIETLKRLAIRQSDGFVAISRATAADFSRLYRIPPALIHPTPLAADPIFRPQSVAAIADLRKQLSLPDRYVLYLGSNKPHKNLPRLIEAWAELFRSPPPAPRPPHLAPRPPLIIAGAWDPRYPEAKQRAQDLSLENSVHFLGPVKSHDLPALYAGADLFVFPSLYEGFGQPVLEAMACGTAVCCSNTSSLPEVAGDAAFLFDPTDVQAMAGAVQRLLRDDTLRATLAQRGLAQAARFSWDRTAQLTLQAYKTVLA